MFVVPAGCWLISIHALLAESDSTTIITTCTVSKFLSTLSLRRATVLGIQHKVGEFISIHALLAESDQANAVDQILPGHISIHALLAESDNPASITPTASRNFYPRSPCGERPITIITTCTALKFLSTLSLRRATNTNLRRHRGDNNFYPRSPCGERRYLDARKSCDVCDFYPRSPCGERPNQTDTKTYQGDFYPRSPCGERPRTGLTCGGGRNISIHALLAESDPGKIRIFDDILRFLSTLSLRRATKAELKAIADRYDFYPRSPCGERPNQSGHCAQ